MKQHLKPVQIILILFIAIAPFSFGEVVDFTKLKDALYAIKYEGKEITSISVKGNVNLSSQKVEDFFGFVEGEKLDLYQVNAAIKEIYGYGYFENIAVDAVLEGENVALTLYVEEYPIIRKVLVAGNQEKTDAELQELIDPYLKVDQIFSERRLRDAIASVVASYREKGFLMTYVRPDIRRDDESKSVEIMLNIQEGQEVKVRKIRFHGIEKFRDKDLKSVMETQEDNFFNVGTFKESDFEADKQRIVQYYRSHGYYRAEIENIEISYRWKDPERKQQKDMYIDITVEEGEQYLFGNISITGNKLFTTSELMDDFKSKSNEVYNEEHFVMDYQMIQMKYSEQGYIFSRIRPEPSVNESNKTIAITFEIEEGDKAHIETITVRGNTKTKDYVIERNIDVEEGEIFNAKKIQQSREKIHNTQLFSDVQVDAKPGSTEGLMNLIFDVEEGQTGMISAGGGFGTATGFSLFGEYREMNFLGHGHTLNARGEIGQTRKRISLGYVNPYVMRKPFYLGGEISFNDVIYQGDQPISTNDTNSTYDEYSQYSRISFDISLRLGTYFWDYYSTYFSYKFSYYKSKQTKDHLDGLVPNSPMGLPVDLTETMTYPVYDIWDSSTQIGWETGWYPTHVFSLNLTRDSRNNSMNPTRGWRFSLNTDLYAGYTSLTKYTATGSVVVPIPYTPKFKTALVFYGEFGYIGNSWFTGSIENEGSALFYLNQIEDVRGWYGYSYGVFKQNRSLHPYMTSDSIPSSYGRAKAKFSMEYRLPIVENMVSGVVFLDAGQTWYPEDDTDRNLTSFFDPKAYVYSVGFGARVEMPVFPIRVYFAKRFVYNGDNDYGFGGGIRDFEEDTFLYNNSWKWAGRGWEFVLSMSQLF